MDQKLGRYQGQEPVKKLLIAALCGLLINSPVFGAMAAATQWNLDPDGTASMVNAGGFNIDNANFLADGTVDTNTGNTASPVFQTASYNFAAGDVGAWVYIRSGTNWTPGWYKIASVASNKATLNAAVGAAVVFSTTTNAFVLNTVAGCATVGTPTNGTFGVDYSQQNTAQVTASDFSSLGSATTLTSLSAPFTRVMVGNSFHQNNTGTGGFGIIGWYEIVNFTDASNVILDRTPNSGTASVATTGRVGGSLSLNSTLDDDWAEITVASNTVWISSGVYALGETMASSINGTATSKIRYTGYNLVRGDGPIGNAMPMINCAANSFGTANFYDVTNVAFTGTPTSVVTTGASRYNNVRSTNTSTTAARDGFAAGSNSEMRNCEAVSYRGDAIDSSGASPILLSNSWLHDSNVGWRLGNAPQYTGMGNLVTSCSSAAISMTVANIALNSLWGNTIFGQGPTYGAGFYFTVTGITRPTLYNNIIVNVSTGVNQFNADNYGQDDYNAYSGNGLNTVNWAMGIHDVFTDPGFINVSQTTGNTATTSGSVLTQAGCSGFGNIVPGRDFMFLAQGTGITSGGYGITAVNAGACTITLDIAPGTNATADKVFRVTTGQNFGIGTNYKALGFPGLFQGGYTTGYTDIGAVQRQEAGGATTTSIGVVGN